MMVNMTMEEVTSSTCSLNNNFGLTVQAVLAFTAFCILIVKRLREPKKERRPVMIWFCDTSKQAIGAMLIHFANVFLAELSHEKDPCTWYFINYMLDTTVGLFVIWIALKILHYISVRKGWMRLRMGEYGSPVEFKTWFYQCLSYMGIMFVEKIVILIFFQFKFWSTVKKFILKPVSGYPKLELILVMLIVPFIMNALMFWVIDNFLMRKHRKLISTSYEDLKPVHYHNKNQQYGTSEDEGALHLMEDESKDTLIE